ncbi:LacI family DNA-binding transcriptional regulator [Actinoplanes sp. NBC_00393]|uniref:LacI family DNA-binding transcriptional regulator n=1 Tax=Actinoplanes sp. NBC_00393 TaxID=2975953 RepID=UPI002E24845E
MPPQKHLILYGVKHPYRIREIAAQSGLSQATVDRVLHNRGGVRESTIRQVHQAIAELDRQQSQAPLGGRTFLIDVVLHTSRRYSTAVRDALEAEVPGFAPAALRPRIHLAESSGNDVVRTLDRVGRSRSHGVVVMAPPGPEVADAVARLGVPVVTLNGDLPAGKRIAHVGVDDFDAGATAAYLVEQRLADRAGDVLVINGKGAREAGFRALLQERSPARRLHTVQSADEIRATLAQNPAIRAVYSAGTCGNAEVIAAFAAESRNYDVFVAHGLDRENVGLLRAYQLSAVLHQDLRADLRHACLVLLRAQGALPGPIRSRPSAVQVITPCNVPPGEF